MKKIFSILFLLTITTIGNTQDTYSDIINKAEKLAQNEEDSLAQNEALNQYAKAFKKFPDSLNDYHLYRASLIANNLKDFDKALEYLTPLAEMIEDEEGYPGWDYIVGDYSDEDYANLQGEPRWEKLRKKALVDKQNFFEKLKADEEEFFEVSPTKRSSLDGKSLYQSIKTTNPYLPKQKQNYSISLKVNDSLKTSYFVHLPKTYDPNKKYPVLFFLHGAVRYNNFSEFETKGNLKYWNRYYTKYADKNEVILVFPKANKQYNWMTSDDGFFMVPTIVNQLKKAIHVDNNKIFISGHSNGATGSFCYLMKEPTQFAGFYGFNSYPKVFTGGTFIENTKNRSFINFSTDQDYYFPPNANDSLDKLMQSIKADYQDIRYNGFPHWFPQFDESEPAYQILFSDLLQRERDPFPKEITWEFDDENYGNIDWLTQIKLDTSKAREDWHKNINFKVDSWMEYDDNDSLITSPVDKTVYNFPRKSGKIIAKYENNTFKINTSCIQSFQINISPEKVDLTKDVKVYVNYELIFEGKVGYDKAFIIENFAKNNDSEQLWIDRIPIQVKK